MDTFFKSFLTVRAHPGAVGKVAAKPVGGNGVYSWAEVAKHNTPEDAWLVVEGQVYDVSGWAPQHPGGSVIYSYAGQDATDVFQALHKGAAGRAVLKTRRIGSVPSQDPTAPVLPAVVSDFRALYKRASEQGLLKARPQYYAWKVSELVGMLAFSMFLLYRFGDSSALARWASALVLTVFTSQCGWTCHDFLHNQVFTSRRANELAGGAILCFGMGGSMHWWKTKHNQHHATPNKLGAGDQPEDPDIDTVPLIAWSRELKDQVDSKSRWMIHMQHVLIWPLLALAYVNWVLQGILHIVMYPGVPLKHRLVELAVILAHHGLLNYSIFSNLSLTHALTYWVIVHGLSGFYTAFVFVQSHNGMEVWSGQKDFVTAQIVTTRNVAPNAVLDWFFGGLNYQIEHHLFPTMPRHNFKAVRPMVMQLCAKHGLPYESLSLAGSTMAVYRTLADLAATKDE